MPVVDEHLLRELAPQVLGAVVRRFGDFSAAEDAVQEALMAATVQWPHGYSEKFGVPSSGTQAGSGCVASLPSSAPFRIAVIGRQ